MHVTQGTSDGQDHKRIQCTGQERDTSRHFPIRASRWRGRLIHGKQLAGVAAQGPKPVFTSAVITKVLAANYKKVNKFLH